MPDKAITAMSVVTTANVDDHVAYWLLDIDACTRLPRQ
jgi:hypothetical protein